MAAVAMFDSDQQASFKHACVAIQSRNIPTKFFENIGWKMWEWHQFRLRELNVPVIFTDKGLLQIRATNIFTD